MKKLFFLATALLALAACNSGIEGTGSPVSESRIVSPFEVLLLEGSMDVKLYNQKKSEEPKVVVHAEGNLQPLILTVVDDPKLVISAEENLRSPSGIVVDVYCNTLLKVINRGSGDIGSDDTFKFIDLTVLNEGSGDIMLTVRGDEIKVTNEGAGAITLFGKGSSADVSLEGSGDIHMKTFQSRTTEVRNEGSGNVTVHAKEELEATLDGSGDIKYLFEGDDDDLDLEQDGSGQMVRLKD